jgi:hypothetical protein
MKISSPASAWAMIWASFVWASATVIVMALTCGYGGGTQGCNQDPGSFGLEEDRRFILGEVECPTRW